MIPSLHSEIHFFSRFAFWQKDSPNPLRFDASIKGGQPTPIASHGCISAVMIVLGQ
jgi:hypothetical protein